MGGGVRPQRYNIRTGCSIPRVFNIPLWWVDSYYLLTLANECLGRGAEMADGMLFSHRARAAARRRAGADSHIHFTGRRQYSLLLQYRPRLLLSCICDSQCTAAHSFTFH